MQVSSVWHSKSSNDQVLQRLKSNEKLVWKNLSFGGHYGSQSAPERGLKFQRAFNLGFRMRRVCLANEVVGVFRSWGVPHVLLTCLYHLSFVTYKFYQVLECHFLTVSFLATKPIPSSNPNIGRPLRPSSRSWSNIPSI